MIVMQEKLVALSQEKWSVFIQDVLEFFKRTIIN